MFHWIVRFFKENDKEEYRLSISSATGEITSFNHIIDDGDERLELTRDVARKRVIQHLR